MQTVLEQGSIDKPLTFDVRLLQLSFIPVCSLNTCNISVKLCEGLHFSAFFIIVVTKAALKLLYIYSSNGSITNGRKYHVVFLRC